MFRQIVFGSVVSLANIALHAMAMTLVVWAARRTSAKWTAAGLYRLVPIMIATVSVLMAAHMCEVALWSTAYGVVAAAPEESRSYFAFVNFTTLGYGDALPTQEWRLLGPMTAMNGVLLFGWSTAVIFEVLRTELRDTPRQ